nr:immunoglobulin heavy chain junction region [Mus musculus]
CEGGGLPSFDYW